MRILLDTNIYIYRESDQVVSEDLQATLASLNHLRAEILIHPLSIEELSRDSDKQRGKRVLSKVGAYPTLESPPNCTNDANFLTPIGVGRFAYDAVDCQLLYSVYKDAVDYIITEDRGIHRDARRVGVEERTLLIAEAKEFFGQMLSRDAVFTPRAIHQVPLHNLDLDDPIFSSLKADYSDFGSWFKKISREGRKAWIYKRNGALGALLVVKDENEAIDSNPPLPKKRRVKISTLMVKHVGYKIGELFIKLAVEYAVLNNIDEIYLTHFIKEKDELIDLITQYGFEHVSDKGDGRKEAIFRKRLMTTKEEVTGLSPEQISTEYYPAFYDGPRVHKFVVPIVPEYHNRLFADNPLNASLYETDEDDLIVEGNTIKKAYLTHSKTTRIGAGDVLLMYRSHDSKAITTIGVVDSIAYHRKDPDEVQRLVGKRTVYTKEEIANMVSRPVTVILFQHHFYLKKLVSYMELYRKGVLSGPPQSIVQITDGGYQSIKEMGEIDGRFTIH